MGGFRGHLGTRGWDMGWLSGMGPLGEDMGGFRGHLGAGTWCGLRGPAWWTTLEHQGMRPFILLHSGPSYS